MVRRLVRSTYVVVGSAVVGWSCGDGGTETTLTVALVNMAAGIQHTCGLTNTGDAFCWGWNRDGQLGDASTRDRSEPVAVQGGHAFTSLAAGGGHTCGLAAGTLYCWGFNLNGQLGDGSTETRAAPTVVAGSIEFASVSAGGSFTCGVALDGAGYCWGWNQFGQLGNGAFVDQPTPTAVSGGLSFTSIVTGNTHTCGVTTADAVYCWGRNVNGQLGNGTGADSPVPTPVVGGGAYVQVALGDEHTCALTVAGVAQCWGRNQFNQIGTPGVALEPTNVAGGLVFEAMFARANYSCGLSNSAGWCWGGNNLGQQAVLSTVACNVLNEVGEVVEQVPCSPEPTQMNTELRYSQLVLGAHHACGVTVGSPVAYCWGGGVLGELGNGRTGSAYFDVVPQKVIGQP